MQFVVRPFRRVLERGPDQPASEVTGAIESDAFIFTVDGARFPIPAVRCGEDDCGPFAVVEEMQQRLEHGFPPDR